MNIYKIKENNDKKINYKIRIVLEDPKKLLLVLITFDSNCFFPQACESKY